MKALLTFQNFPLLIIMSLILIASISLISVLIAS